MAKVLCQPGGAVHIPIVRAHDLRKPKTMAASLKCMCISFALALLVPHGNMSTRENRVLCEETKQHRGMQDFLVQNTRSRNEVPLTLIWSIASEISQKGKTI